MQSKFNSKLVHENRFLYKCRIRSEIENGSNETRVMQLFYFKQ